LDGQKYVLIRVGTKRDVGVQFRLGLCRYDFIIEGVPAFAI